MLCYKRQGNYGVCNELPFSTVGWLVARGAVGYGSFVVRIRKVLFFSFSKFLSLVSFLELGLVLDLGLWLGYLSSFI